MDPMVSELLNLVFRWAHVVVGILWIGHLYFFNFVNAHVAKTYDAESKKKVVPELMPRALYWFRWGAAWTYLTGVLLMGIVYHAGGTLIDYEKAQSMPVAASMIVVLPFLYFIYDALWKSPLAKNETVAAAVSFLLVAVVTFGFSKLMSGRAVYIHLGSLFGTFMAMNVWMRIWPAQRKIINGIKGVAPAPDAAVPALAGLRSKHNTYMSVPLIFFMVSNHYPTLYSHAFGWLFAVLFVALGWGVTKFLYVKSASPVTTEVKVG